MSRPPIFICDLKPENNVWKLVVRVVDLWTVKERNGQLHVEVVLKDAKDNQIHVVTRSREYEMWTQKLLENQTYLVYNGEPLKYDLPLKVCDNEFKLFFNRSTTVTAVDLPDIPHHTFKFKQLEDFLSGNFVVDRVYDVIGVVQQVVRTQVQGASKKACVNLILADESGAEIDMTLWESFATQFMSYADDNGLLVLILTHAMCRQTSSSGKLNLSNAWNGSKLLLNFDSPEVVEFKKIFLDGNPTPEGSQCRSLNSCSQGTYDDKSFSFTKDVMSFSEMLSLTEDSFCNTVGTAKRFKSTQFGWYYEVCPSCNKTNQCICGDNKPTPTTKYKIEIQVEQGNVAADFVFWDKDCIPIVGMTAHSLRQLMKQTNEDHPLIYPEHLDKLLGKPYAFRVKWQPTYKQAFVVKLTLDEDVIQQIQDAMTPTEFSAIIPTTDADLNGKVIMPAEDLNHDTILTQTSNSKTTALAAQNWSPETSYNNTPAKRVSQDAESQEAELSEMLPPKQSATKGARNKSARDNKNK